MAKARKGSRRARFAEFLRTSKIKKGRDRLKTNTGAMCCLGKLCEFYRLETGEGEWVRIEERWHFDLGGDSDSLLPPATVMEWVGLSAGGVVRFEGEQHGLPYLNDGDTFGIPDKGLSHAKIADLIEQ